VAYQVFVVRCPAYEQAGEQLDKLIKMMGGMSRFAGPGEQVALKANLLIGSPPEKAVTIHPAVVAAAGRLAKAQGAAPFIIDSPASGLPHTAEALKRTYLECGMTRAAQQEGLELCMETAFETVSFPDGHLVRRFEIMTPILKAGSVINLCKLKTHTYMGMSGAVKNLFGVIPGRAKVAYHASLSDPALFAQMMLDLAQCITPRLSIMDAVVGMEGDGPCAGTPRQAGFLLAAENPLALDIVAGEIMGLPRASNMLLVEAEKRGLKPNLLEDIEIVGVDLPELRLKGFKLPITMSRGGGWDRGAGMTWWQILLVPLLVPLLKNGMTVRPQVIPGKCTACGVCRKGCPADAIEIRKNGRGTAAARIDNGACLRCYCCHEMCAQHAIRLEKNPLYQWLGL
jgi:uncharacterized protein (DUF362 family)/ferredoxin